MRMIRRLGRRKVVLLAVGGLVMATGLYHGMKPIPAGLDYAGPFRAASDVQFLRDVTWYGPDGARELDQEIFPNMLAIIGQAEQLIVLDQFLFNAYAGKVDQVPQRLSHMLTEALVTRMQEEPGLQVWFITDPINTLYGDEVSPFLQRLEEAGATIVMTHLPALRDSNPVYSVWWRLLLRYWPRSWPPRLANPLGEGTVALRSWLDLLNFKANHRKTLVADDGDGGLVGLVSSANPHDASSAHHNVAVRFRGQAAWDLLQTERAVCRFSGAAEPVWGLPQADPDLAPDNGSLAVRILTERAVARYLLARLGSLSDGDAVQVAMFYLSDRAVVRALLAAHQRGVRVQVLLDPNKDAFGRKKNGIPNRQVAHALDRAGIAVRWVLTRGEQFHTKMTLVSQTDGRHELLVGSSNYTRRNLRNLNLETCAVIRGAAADAVFERVSHYWAVLWDGSDGRSISGGYARYADGALHRRLLYRIMEATGMSTF